MDCSDILFNIFHYLTIPNVLRLMIVDKNFRHAASYWINKNQHRSLLLKWKKTQDFLIKNCEQIGFSGSEIKTKSFFIHDLGLLVYFLNNIVFGFTFEGLHFLIEYIPRRQIYGHFCCANYGGNSLLLHDNKFCQVIFQLRKLGMMKLIPVEHSKTKLVDEFPTQCIHCWDENSDHDFKTESGNIYIVESKEQPGECLQFGSSIFYIGHDNHFHFQYFENFLLILNRDGYDKIFDYKDKILKPIDHSLPFRSSDPILFNRINNNDFMIQSKRKCYLLREGKDKFSLISQFPKHQPKIMGYCEFDRLFYQLSNPIVSSAFNISTSVYFFG